MTPSLMSVLLIFVLAPLAVVLFITAVVFLLVSPSRLPVPRPVDELQDPGLGRDGESDADSDELQEQGSDLDGESDADSDELQEQGWDLDGESDADIEGEGDPR